MSTLSLGLWKSMTWTSKTSTADGGMTLPGEKTGNGGISFASSVFETQC